MAEFRGRTNRQQTQDFTLEKQRRLDIQQAGLALREDQIAAQEERAEAQLKLEREKFEFQRGNEEFDRKLKGEARKHSVLFKKGLAGVRVDDPDFETHVAALEANFPYAMFEDSTVTAVGAMRAAALKAAEGRAKLAQETGVDPIQFVKRDPSGRFLGVDNAAMGAEIGKRQMEKLKTAATLVTTLPGSTGKADLTGKLGDVDVKTSVQTDLSKVTENAAVLKPEVAAGLANKAGGNAVDLAIAKGTAEQEQQKLKLREQESKRGNIAVQIRALTESADINTIDPTVKAKLDALLKELETTSAPVDDKVPDWKKKLLPNG